MREPAFWYRRPSLISLLLSPLGAVYGLVSGRRMQRAGFDAGIPVLCIGNYHLGGAGKTPAALALTTLGGVMPAHATESSRAISRWPSAMNSSM